MKKLTLASALLLCAFCAARTCALELALEENRAETGTIGYVDLERVFVEHPETLKAKENFQKDLSFREKYINGRKEEIFALRAELEKLRRELETLRSLAGCEVLPSTAAATGQTPPQPLTYCPDPPLPPYPFEMVEEAVSTAAVAGPVPYADLALVRRTEPVLSAGQTGQEALLRALAPLTPVAEMETNITERMQELKDKEAALTQYKKTAEQDLLKLENSRTRYILGKIYIIMKDLADEEGLSVVVDKKNILFGQRAVDLTDKLLERLRSDQEKAAAQRQSEEQ